MPLGKGETITPMPYKSSLRYDAKRGACLLWQHILLGSMIICSKVVCRKPHYVVSPTLGPQVNYYCVSVDYFLPKKGMSSDTIQCAQILKAKFAVLFLYILTQIYHECDFVRSMVV